MAEGVIICVPKKKQANERIRSGYVLIIIKNKLKKIEWHNYLSEFRNKIYLFFIYFF